MSQWNFPSPFLVFTAMRCLIWIVCLPLVCSAPLLAANRITFDENGVLEMNGRKMFVVSLAVPPPLEGKTPWGNDALAEFKDAGANYMRVTLQKKPGESMPAHRWTDEGLTEFQRRLDGLARHGMYGWIYIYELGAIDPDAKSAPAKEKRLRDFITRFKDHRGNGGWKGADEPAWGKVKPEAIIHAYDVIKQIDKDHPVLVLHAPKGQWQSLVPYMKGADVTGADIFPIGYPPGRHGDLPNRLPSVVGDYTDWMKQAAGGKPVWMTLQIAWSGVARRGKFLRFPTAAQERFMTYEAIIHGARGVNYFGGGIPSTLNDRDQKFGWNWTFWQRVLRPVIEEIGDQSPLRPALVAPDSKLKIQAQEIVSISPQPSTVPAPRDTPVDPAARFPPAHGLDFRVREVGDEVFLLAAAREGPTVKVRFVGLPVPDQTTRLLYEEPRSASVRAGVLDDWFGPEEVHVYRLKRK